jgi:hypothetical protein
MIINTHDFIVSTIAMLDLIFPNFSSSFFLKDFCDMAHMFVTILFYSLNLDR